MAAVETPRIPPTPNVFRVSPTASETVHRRLDALDARLSWFYVRLLLLTGVSWAVHAAELVLFAFTRRFVAHDVGMGTYALEALGVGVFLGAALGGPLFGLLADARGRRSALLFAMTISLVGLALSAVAKKDYQVVIARIVAGIGLGGELPAATVLVQELSPSCVRGRMVALLEAFTGVGGVVGVALAFGLAPQLGWRITYLAICSCVLYAGVLRFGIPESPRWLASAGRVDEALLVVGKLEQAHGLRPRYDNLKIQDLPTPVAVEAVPSAARVKPSAFERPVHTLVLWTLWTVMAMSSYALGVYVPTLISMSGFNMYANWGTIALLHGAQVVGCILASWMLETRGRKQSLACFATLTSVVSVLLSYSPWYQLVVIAGTCSVSALLAGTWSCVLAYTPENYPTAVRARGVSYAFGLSRLGAAGGALLYPHMFDVWLMSVSAITWVFAGLLAATVLGIVVPYGFTPSTNGYSNEYRATSTKSGEPDLDLESNEILNLRIHEGEEEEEEFFDNDRELKILATTDTTHEPEQEVSPKSGHRD
ncbi:Major Facilitator Superfamily (MFS) transporter [Phytophthora cinnamomi]|uniref:Major Facilitator Superfamily (MFS) transporter n=1 Tax=Phytophthora cinnamomi TaxID=4785 RepID=UPI003559EFF4|nr:Major Facilitator Superfamily (MFS) transporter [Phytophthora cinnamomi]